MDATRITRRQGCGRDTDEEAARMWTRHGFSAFVVVAVQASARRVSAAARGRGHCTASAWPALTGIVGGFDCGGGRAATWGCCRPDLLV